MMNQLCVICYLKWQCFLTESQNRSFRAVKNIHLSFDIDCITTRDCPGVNVPNRWNNGITKEQAFKTLNTFLDNLNIVSMDIVEYNPLTDINNKSLNVFLESINLAKKKLKKSLKKRLTLSFLNGIMFKLSFARAYF